MRQVDDALATEFDAQRSRLIGLAYRVTGSLADAEDAVQEAWLRLSALDDSKRTEIRDLGAWLSTVVGRLCVDRARSATMRREHYVGPWLPEPIVTAQPHASSPDPLEAAVRSEDMRMAALRILQQLTPDQRVAFVLHDGFEVGFEEIADMLGCTTAAARQHASRARRAMADADPPQRVPAPAHREVIDGLLTALAAGDEWAVARMLDPRVSVHGDSDGKARTALRPVVGRDKVVRFMLGLMSKYSANVLLRVQPVLVNGDPGLLLPGSSADVLPARAASPRVVGFAVRDGRVAEIHDIVNPDKLVRVSI